MKVLAAIVVPPHLSASGGARAGLRLSEALASHCDITVAAMTDIDSERGGAPRVPVRSWLPRSFRAMPQRYRSLFYASDIPRIVERGGYDLVHLHNPMPALEMARIARACVRARIPYVVSTHGFNEIANGSEVYKFDLLRRQAWQTFVRRPVSQVVKSAAGLFALSAADLAIVKALGYAGTPAIVPNGVDPPPPANSALDEDTWKRFDLPSREAFSGIVCMFLANHTPNKGVPVLLEAFAKLDCPYLLIVGGERRPDIDYRQGPSQRADQRIVVTGRLTDPEVHALLRRSDLFVFPTLADTFPLVVLEAMAHGVPVLASEVGGIPFQVDASCGRLVPPGDAAALRNAVKDLAADPERLRRMGQAARVRVTTEFSWSAAAKLALQGYRQQCPNAE